MRNHAEMPIIAIPAPMIVWNDQVHDVHRGLIVVRDVHGVQPR